MVLEFIPRDFRPAFARCRAAAESVLPFLAPHSDSVKRALGHGLVYFTSGHADWFKRNSHSTAWFLQQPRLHAAYIGSSFDYSQQDTSSQIDWNRGRNQTDSTSAIDLFRRRWALLQAHATAQSLHQEFHSRTLSILSTYSPSSVFVQCHPLLITNSYFIHNSLKSATRQ
ncbi:hypothetical protein PGT21_001149 [Puccinia graminis f. sp. tritici]|uniref:Uncharacterized protein n=1 Tax=Puccinia graminis f. sp. tritici TaxID=56615 RepID=A0A5B0M948_PUCGR|nr:hypothetical protein PGT21_001149 [Puccinia graminis f. sp. tritici]